MMNPPKVKICCIASLEEAKLAIQRGASALGLVSQMPSGPGVIAESTIAEIAAAAPRTVDTFLLTCIQDSAEIIEQHKRCKTTTIQLCDQLMNGNYEELRESLPGVALVQVIHVMGEEAIQEAIRVAPNVDALLLDSGNPSLKTKELGGTGRTHNWQISRRIRDSVSIPVYLAGGLRPENVLEAVQAVEPFGLDLCSGVRTDGKLDTQKLRAFMDSINTLRRNP